MSLFILSQILVGVAICFDLLSCQFKERSRIIACLIISCLLVTVHFALLAHWTAMGLGGLVAFRFIVSSRTTSKKVMAAFIAASLIVTALTFHGPLSLLSCTGSIFGTIGSFCADDKRLRQLLMAASSLWLLHNILAPTPVAALMEALFLTSNLVGYYRYYGRRQKDAPPPAVGPLRQ